MSFISNSESDRERRRLADRAEQICFDLANKSLDTAIARRLLIGDELSKTDPDYDRLIQEYVRHMINMCNVANDFGCA